MNSRPLLAAPLLALGLLCAGPAAPVRAEPVKIGWTTWQDAEIVSKMAALILEKGMGVDTELTLSDIAIQYRSVALGELDAMMMAWLPQTHAAYMDQYGDALIDHATLYDNARLGIAVSAACPDSLASLADLATPEGARAIGGRILGIDPGSGIMRMTRDTLTDLGADLELTEGTDFSMARDLGQAIESGACVAATLWNPHWLFGAYELRYLDDPDHRFGRAESVHVVVRRGFAEDFPKAAGLLGRISFDIAEIEAILARGQEIGPEEAIREWLNANNDRVTAWMTGS